MQIVDHRGGGQASLQLQIEEPKPLSLISSATMQQVLHSEPLTGHAVSLHLHTTLLLSHMHHQQVTDSYDDYLGATRAIVCSVSPPVAVRSITVDHSTAQHGRCTFILAAALPKALSEVVLHATVAGEPHLSASVPVKIWQLDNVAVTQLWQFDHPTTVLKRVSGSLNCTETSDMCETAVICLHHHKILNKHRKCENCVRLRRI